MALTDCAPVRALDRILPDDPPAARAAERSARRWGAQIAAGVGVAAVAQIVGVAVGLAASVLLGELAAEDLSITAVSTLMTRRPIGFLVQSVVAATIALAGYWALMRWVRGGSVTELAGRGKGREIAAGVVVGAVLLTVVVAVTAAAGSYRVLAVGWSPGFLVGLSAGIGAGFVEELVFRGVMLRLTEQWLGTWAALGASALLFGALHLTNSEATVFGCVCIVVEAGILLGACYLATRRLWLVIGVHVAWNTMLGGVYGSDISGTGTGRGIIEAEFPGPALLTGGRMGLEGSVVTLVLATLLGVLMVLVAVRRGQVMAPSWRRRSV